MKFSRQGNIPREYVRRGRSLAGFIAAAAMVMAARGADVGPTHGIMHLTPEQWAETQLAHFRAPQLSAPQGEQRGFKGSLTLLSRLPYVPQERQQGDCGNCWQWAGTGVMEVAHDVQNGVHDRLSVQFINSCRDCGCDGGNLPTVAAFYAAQGFAVPWANNNAQFQDAGGTCTVPCGNIVTTPRYTINNIAEQSITTTGVGQAQAIANIKYVLNQNKAIYFGFRLPTTAAWNQFYSFWNNESETAVWNNYFCGQTWDNDGGGHAVLCVGYNDDDPQNRYWLMVNSWSTTAQRPNGLFRVSMDLDYDCMQNDGGTQLYAMLWETLNVEFAPSGPAAPVLAPEPAVTSGTANTIYWAKGEGRSEPAGAVTQSDPPPGFPLEGAWQPILTEGFELGFPGTGWTVSGTPTWDDTTFAYHGGSRSAWCGASLLNPTYGYADNMNAWMKYGPFNLADARDASVSFWYKNSSESTYDYFGWYASTNNSDFFGSKVSGDQSTWRAQTFSFTNVYNLGNLCGQSQVWLAFIFTSDASNSGPDYGGAYVDDVVIEKDVAAGAGPDLAPFQLANWNDKIPIGLTKLYATNSHSYTGPFSDSQPLYFNWSSRNQGGSPCGAYRIHVEVTGTGGGSWDFDVTTNRVGSYWYLTQDQAVGPLGAGSHTFKQWVDYNGTVTETNENNNYYERTIQVGTAGADYYAECANNANFTEPQYSGWLQATQYTFTGLAPGQTYWYRVKARLDGQESAWSNVEHSQQQTGAASRTIAGTVQYYGPAGGPLTVAGVTMNLSGDTNQTAQTDATGNYSFQVNQGGTYTVTPSRTSDTLPATGVSTVDISLIRRHILQIAALDSPYKLLAADANGSHSATTMDITFIRQLILGISNQMPAGVWRFVPAAYVFPDSQNPWSAPAALSFANITADQLNQNFLAIKLGDVNTSWSKSKFPSLSKSAATPELALSSHTTAAGTMVTAKISASGFKQVTSAQFTLEWDPAVLQYISTGDYGARGLGTGNFGTLRCREGWLAVSWDDPEAVGVTLPDGVALCTVNFRAVGPPGSASPLALTDEITPRELGVNFVAVPVRVTSGEVHIVDANAVQFTQPGYVDGTFRVSVPTQSGISYILEYAESLRNPRWTSLPAVAGNGAVRTLVDPNAKSQERYYRVRVE